jgi:hypothetical protein
MYINRIGAKLWAILSTISSSLYFLDSKLLAAAEMRFSRSIEGKTKERLRNEKENIKINM